MRGLVMTKGNVTGGQGWTVPTGLAACLHHKPYLPLEAFVQFLSIEGDATSSSHCTAPTRLLLQHCRELDRQQKGRPLTAITHAVCKCAHTTDGIVLQSNTKTLRA